MFFARDRPSSTTRWATVARLVALAVAYLLGAMFGIWLTRRAGGVAAFWPANGLALALLLFWRDVPRSLGLGACGLACLLANLLHGDALGLASLLACLNLLEVGLALGLLRWWIGGDRDLAYLRSLLGSFGTAVFAPAVTASLAAVLLPPYLGGSAGVVWLDWFSSNVVPMWLCLAMVLARATDDRTLGAAVAPDSQRRQRLIEASTVLLGTSALGLAAVIWSFGSPGLFLPTLLWCAWRQGPAWTALASLVLAATMTTGVMVGMWPWNNPDDVSFSLQMAHLQLVLLCLTTSALAASILVRQREIGRRELERKNGENELYRIMVQELPDCLSVKGREGRFIIANDATARLMGAESAQALLGRSDEDFHEPELARRYRADEVAFLDRGEVMVVEQPVRFPDGRSGWLSSLKAPFHDRAGAIIGIITHNRDITLQKQLQFDLAEARRQLEDAVASMSDGFALFGPDDRLILCNESYRRIFPRTAHLRQPGIAFTDLVRAGVERGEYPPVADLEAFVAEAVATLRRASHREVALVAGRWIDIHTQPARGGGTILNLRDISQRKRLELQVTTAKAQIDDALRSMADGFVVFDREDRLEICNDRYRQLFPRTAALRIPGAHREALIRAGVAQGEYREIDADDQEAFIRRAVATTEGNWEQQLSNGIWLEITTRRTGRGGTVHVYRDITQRKMLESRLQHQANHDPMTRLANRAMFHAELQRSLAKARRDGGKVAVMLIDLDHFKQVNDTHGHDTGDKLLIEVARRLESCVRQSDLVARLGGDEFAVLLAFPAECVAPAAFAARLIERLSEPLRIGTITLVPGGSLGFAMFPDDASQPDDLLHRADRALYAAKAAGRGTWFGSGGDGQPSRAQAALPSAEPVDGMPA